MEKLKLYFIDNDYIEYLRKFDERVAYNKIPNRPYIGVVYTYNNFLKPLNLSPSPNSAYKYAIEQINIVIVSILCCPSIIVKCSLIPS